MNLAYTTAAFYIGAISANPNFSIHYHSLEALKYNSRPDVVSYINKESKGDVFFIFKKFPDIFVLKGNFVTLTDSFLALHIFAKYPKESWFVAYAENVAVEYFKRILCHSGGMHLFDLFNMLITQNIADLSYYFSKYRHLDMYNFFQNHSDIFIINSDYIYLRLLSLDKNAHEVVKKELYDYINFLLTCFKTLHYIELKQCISYMNTVIKNYLNLFSLVKQREIFENSSSIIMDVYGFLSLKSLEINTHITNDNKIILLVICILAFEKKMHYKKIVQQVQLRLSPKYNYILCNLPKKEKVLYFKKYPQYFRLTGEAYVELAFPLFFPDLDAVRENLNLNNIKKSTYKIPKSSNIIQISNDASNPIINTVKNYTFASDISKNKENAILNESREKLSTQTSPFSIENKNSNAEIQLETNNICDLQKYAHNSVQMPRIDYIKIYHAMVFLHNWFPSITIKNAFLILFHTLTEFHKYFCNISYNEQLSFITKCLMKVLIGTSCDLLKLNINEEEKIVLYTTYLLIKHEVLHFENIIKQLKNVNMKNGPCTFNIYEQFQYLKQLNKYFVFKDDGYITLNSSFNHIKYLVNQFPNVLSDTLLNFPKIAIQNQTDALQIKNSKENLSPEINKANDKENVLPEALNTSQLLLEKFSQNDSRKNINLNVGINVKQIAVENNKNKPQNKTLLNYGPILERIYHSLIYLNNSFSKLSTVYFLQAIIHSLIDVHDYFFQLSSVDQGVFLKEIFLYINAKEQNIVGANTILDFKIKENEKIVLFITYLLIKEHRLHFEKIFHKLLSVHRTNSTCNLSIKSQFKYIKELNHYFKMAGTGYVELSSIITEEQSAINSFTDLIASKFLISKHFCNETKATYQDDKFCDKFSKMSVNSEKKLDENLSSVLQCKSSDAYNVENIIIELCYSILMASNEMHIEKLCSRLVSCNYQPVQRFFSFMTLSDKIKFFKEKQCYFKINKDNIVKLSPKNHSFVPLTNINLIELLTSNSKNDKVIHMSEKSESVKSFDTSEVSDVVSIKSDFSAQNKKRHKRKKGKRSILNSKLSTKVHEPDKQQCFETKPNSVRHTSHFCSEKFINIEEDSTSPNVVFNKFETKREIFKSAKSKLYNKIIMNHLNSKNHQLYSVLQLKSKSSSNDVESVENVYKGNFHSNMPTDIISGSQPFTECSNIEKNSEDSMFDEKELQIDTCESSIANESIVSGESVHENIDLYTKPALQNYLEFDQQVSDKNSLEIPVTEFDTTESGIEQISMLPSLPFQTKNAEKCVNMTSSEMHLQSEENCSMRRQPIQNSTLHNKLLNCVSSSSKCDFDYALHDKSYGLELVDEFLCKQEHKNDKINVVSDAVKQCVNNSTKSAVELSAVNFFSIILGRYDIGVSACFLRKHLSLASEKVKNYIHDNFPNDILPFFQKHDNVFYVSEFSGNIYLIESGSDHLATKCT